MYKRQGNTECAKFFESVEDGFLSQHIQLPTRGHSVLDLVLTRDPDLVSNVEVMNNLGCSDHNMIAFSVHHTGYHNDYVVRRRDYQKGDYKSMKSILEDTDWDERMNGDTVLCWQKFKELILNLESKYVPMKSIRLNKRRKPVWMSYKALKCVKKKRKVFSKYKDKDHPAVKRANQISKNELKKARRNFEKMLAMNIKCDSKSFYAYARSKSKSKVQVGSLIDSHGRQISEDKDIVTHLNEYFSSVFTKEDLTNIPKPVPVGPYMQSWVTAETSI